MSLIKCPECGKEISDQAKMCPHCGCPIMDTDIVIQESSKLKNKKVKTFFKKPMILISLIIAIVVIIGLIIIEQTYEKGIKLLENGNYQDGQDLLEIVNIINYKDSDLILEQIKWESRVAECIVDMRQHLRNPDSLQIYEISFYEEFREDVMNTIDGEVDPDLLGEEPICIMRNTAQNGFGGNTIGYSIFYATDGTYKYMGSCNTLDENKLIDEDNLLICRLINLVSDNFKKIGNVDISRIETIMKNGSYSKIKIIN